MQVTAGTSGVTFLGAGNYASCNINSSFSKTVNLETCVSMGGVSAKYAEKNLGSLSIDLMHLLIRSRFQVL